MSRITAVTGQSNIKAGVTDFRLGLVKANGMYVVRELHRHFVNRVTDASRQRVNASTMGANSGVLGDWVTRDIDVPDDTVLFISYSIKSSSMPIKKTLTFALNVSDGNPYTEWLFPVVTDRHSTYDELPFAGRFRLLNSAEIEAHRAKHVREGSLSLMHDAAIKTLEGMMEEGVLNYWKHLSSPQNHGGNTFLTVEGGSHLEEYQIRVKYQLAPLTAAQRPVKGKQVKTATGRKVTISSRKRKLKLS